MSVNKEFIEEDFNSIQADPFEEELPYAQIPNALLRDQSISPQCRWLLAFLLSNAPGWKINRQQVINHCRGFIGRDRVHRLFEEALESGYMRKELTKSYGNLNSGVKYYISRSPKFKKCFRCPENKEPGGEDSGDQAYKNNNKEERQCSKKTNLSKKNDKEKGLIEKPSALPSFDTHQNSIVSFDPHAYKLRDGKILSLRTARAFAKYWGEESANLKANILWYENQIDNHNRQPKNHEIFLQWAINNNMASKHDNSWQNEMYAKMIKQDKKIGGMKILKTVVQMESKYKGKSDSIRLDLHPETFAEILDNYVKNY